MPLGEPLAGVWVEIVFKYKEWTRGRWFKNPSSTAGFLWEPLLWCWSTNPHSTNGFRESAQKCVAPRTQFQMLVLIYIFFCAQLLGLARVVRCVVIHPFELNCWVLCESFENCVDPRTQIQLRASWLVLILILKFDWELCNWRWFTNLTTPFCESL